MSILLFSRGETSTKHFIQKLFDLWTIRKKDLDTRLGLLPSDDKVRENVINYINSEIIHFDKWMWGDSTKENYLTYKNITISDFKKPDLFYKEYMIDDMKMQDPILKRAYKNPNETLKKYSFLNPDLYRETFFYKNHIANHDIEDGIISNFINPHNGVTTFISTYRADYDKKYFFDEEDKEKQHFIFSILTLNPHYSIVFCDEHGFVYHDDLEFWYLCREEFPHAVPPIPNKLPNILLANLIKWNQQEKNKKTFKRVDFTILQYNEIYCIQAISKDKKEIPETTFSIKEPSNSYSIGCIRQKPENPVSPQEENSQPEQLSENTKNAVIGITDNPDLSEGKVNILQKENKVLKDLLTEKDQEIKALNKEKENIKQENLTLIEENIKLKNHLKDIKSSVITDTPNLPEETRLTPPEVAPVLFAGRQAESLDFLEKHYGQYLTYFGAEKDVLFQYQLAKLDKRLANAVRSTLNYRRKKEKGIPTYTEIIPPKSKEIDLALETVSEPERRRVTSLYNTAKYREKMNR